MESREGGGGWETEGGRGTEGPEGERKVGKVRNAASESLINQQILECAYG